MFQILSYINYWFHQVDEHSLHSPFLFDFYDSLIKKSATPSVEPIEKLRQKLLQTNETIQFEELGAGSQVEKSSQRRISKIAQYSTTPLKFSLFLRGFIEKYACKNVLELGTSLGINTLYLSEKADVRVTTIEGEPTISSMAQQHFHAFKRDNIRLLNNSIDEIIEKGVLDKHIFDLIYLDANHQYEPTLLYFDYFQKRLTPNGVIIIDDIHWSKGMNNAWSEIIQQSEVSLSIDLFEAGLVFFNPELPRENLILKF